MLKGSYLLILLSFFNVAMAEETEELGYMLSSKISDHILNCELDSFIELGRTDTDNSLPKYKFRVERASKNRAFMSGIWEGEGRMPYDSKRDLLGFYEIANDDEVQFIANSYYGKLVIRYNHIAQDKSFEDRETTLFISVMTAERQQLGRVYAGTGFCKIAKESSSHFPFKDAQIPPLNYSYAKLYYYPDMKKPNLLMGISDLAVASIVKEHKGSKVKHSDWTEILREPNPPKYARAGCYIPRHLLVFFDKNDTPLSYVEVCLQCKGYRTSDFETKVDIHEFAKLVDAVGLPISPEGISLEKFLESDRKLLERMQIPQ